MNETTPEKRNIFALVSFFTLTLLMNTWVINTACATELTILFSNDIRGEIEPCG